MPFASKPIIDEEKKKAPSTGGGGGVGMGLPGQDKTRGEKSSGSYANIQDYLKANQTQGAKMGSDIAGSVSKSAEQAKSDIGKLSAEAPKVAAYDPNKVISQVVGPVSTQDKSNYQAMKATGGYTGPESIEKTANYNAAQEATRKAAEKVGLAGGEIGQQDLLRQQYGRPQYTAGQNKLDQMLLQGSAAGKAAMEGVRSKYADLENLFGGASEKTKAAITAAQKQALANKQAIGQAETAAWKGLIDPIQARAAQMNIDNPEIVKRLQEDLADENIGKEAFGLTGLKSGQNIYDIDLRKFLTPNLTQVGLNEAANAKERGKYQALADLFGDPTRTEITTDGKAISPVIYNKAGLENEIATKNAEADRILNKDIGLIKGGKVNPDYLGIISMGGADLDSIAGDHSKMTLSQIEKDWLPKAKAFADKYEKKWINSASDKYQKNYIREARNVIYNVEKQIKDAKKSISLDRKVGGLKQAPQIQVPKEGQVMPGKIFTKAGV